MNSLRRATVLYSQAEKASAAYLLDHGMVKLTRSTQAGSRVILAISGKGQLIGEEALSNEDDTYYTTAEILMDSAVYRIPQSVLNQVLSNDRNLGHDLVRYLIERKLSLAEKVELLCLRDVEYRILHYLGELSEATDQSAADGNYHIPITQLELADLVGATRETTSTTLNSLERRGLVKLSRRLLTVPDLGALQKARQERGDLANSRNNGSAKRPKQLVPENGDLSAAASDAF